MYQSNPYAKAKKLKALDLGESKTWTGETTHELAEIKGHYFARELYHLDAGLIGFERIFYKHDHLDKFPKRPSFIKGYSGEKSPLFTPIGCTFSDIDKQQKIIITGGFADGVTVYNALGQHAPVLAILGESNAARLVEQIKERYPHIKILAALDGDMTGRRESIRCNTQWITPDTGDWNDLYISSGLDAVSSVFQAVNNPIPHYDFKSTKRDDSDTKTLLKKLSESIDYYEIALISIELTKRNAKKIPIKWENESAFVAYLLAHNYRIHAETIDGIKSHLSTAIKEAKKTALSYITMSDAKYRHDYSKIKSLEEVPTEQRGITLISAPHGIGKTERVGVPFIKSKIGNAVALCHLRSLVADMATRFDIHHYGVYADSVKDIMSNSGMSKTEAITFDDRDAMAICLPSIVLTLEEQVKKTGTLLIDEVSQVLSFLAVAKMKGFDNVAVYKRLEQVIRTAEKVLMMDADLDDSVIEFLESICPNETFSIYELPRIDNGFNVEWVYGKSGNVRAISTAEQRIISALHCNMRLIVASDSKATTKAIHALISTTYPSKTVLRIDADTTETKAVKEFLRAPSDNAHKYDVIVHSPSMRSGVSIVRGGFDLGIGIFTGSSICPQDAIQMLRRDRKLRNFLICIDENGTEKGLTAQAMEHAQEYCDQLVANVDGRIYGDKAISFDILRNRQLEKEISSKSEFALNLYHMLVAYKFKITHCEDRSEQVSEISTIKKLHRIEWEGAILKAPTISTFDYDRLKQQKTTTFEEKASIASFKIREFLHVDKIDPSILDMWDEGRCKKSIRLLETLISDDHGQESETDKDKTLSLRAFNGVRSELFHEFVGVIGLSVEGSQLVGEVSITHEGDFAKWHQSNRLVLAYLNLIPAKFANAKTPVPKELKKAIKGILDKASISMKTDKQRVGDRKDEKRERTLSPDKEKMTALYVVINARVGTRRTYTLNKNTERVPTSYETSPAVAVEDLHAEITHITPSIENDVLVLIGSAVNTFEELTQHIEPERLASVLTGMIDRGEIVDDGHVYSIDEEIEAV